MIVQEQALEHLLKCPIMVPVEPSGAELSARALFSWALRQSFDGKFHGEAHVILHNMRGKFLELWAGHKDLEAGSLARTAAFRLLGLVVDYEVIHLEQPYNLILGKHTIHGRYALLRKRKGECLPYILVLHTSEPGLRHNHTLPPDIATLARYVHVCTTTQYIDTRVLHYPVFKGKPWTNKGLDMPLAKRYLESMLEVSDIHPHHPVMGEHCEQCSSKPCMKVFHG